MAMHLPVLPRGLRHTPSLPAPSAAPAQYTTRGLASLSRQPSVRCQAEAAKEALREGRRDERRSALQRDERDGRTSQRAPRREQGAGSDGEKQFSRFGRSYGDGGTRDRGERPPSRQRPQDRDEEDDTSERRRDTGGLRRSRPLFADAPSARGDDSDSAPWQREPRVGRGRWDAEDGAGQDRGPRRDSSGWGRDRGRRPWDNAGQSWRDAEGGGDRQRLGPQRRAYASDSDNQQSDGDDGGEQRRGWSDPRWDPDNLRGTRGERRDRPYERRGRDNDRWDRSDDRWGARGEGRDRPDERRGRSFGDNLGRGLEDRWEGVGEDRGRGTADRWGESDGGWRTRAPERRWRSADEPSGDREDEWGGRDERSRESVRDREWGERRERLRKEDRGRGWGARGSARGGGRREERGRSDERSDSERRMDRDDHDRDDSPKVKRADRPPQHPSIPKNQLPPQDPRPPSSVKTCTKAIKQVLVYQEQALRPKGFKLGKTVQVQPGHRSPADADSWDEGRALTSLLFNMSACHQAMGDSAAALACALAAMAVKVKLGRSYYRAAIAVNKLATEPRHFHASKQLMQQGVAKMCTPGHGRGPFFDMLSNIVAPFKKRVAHPVTGTAFEVTCKESIVITLQMMVDPANARGVAAAAVGAPRAPADIMDLKEDIPGQKHFNAGEYQQALDSCKEWVEMVVGAFPEFLGLFGRRTDLEIQGGSAYDALHDAITARVLGDNSAEAMAREVRALLKLNWVEAAQHSVTQALVTHPTSEELQRVRDQVARAWKRKAKAARKAAAAGAEAKSPAAAADTAASDAAADTANSETAEAAQQETQPTQEAQPAIV